MTYIPSGLLDPASRPHAMKASLLNRVRAIVDEMVMLPGSSLAMDRRVSSIEAELAQLREDHAATIDGFMANKFLRDATEANQRRNPRPRAEPMTELQAKVHIYERI